MLIDSEEFLVLCSFCSIFHFMDLKKTRLLEFCLKLSPLQVHFSVFYLSLSVTIRASFSCLLLLCHLFTVKNGALEMHLVSLTAKQSRYPEVSEPAAPSYTVHVVLFLFSRAMIPRGSQPVGHDPGGVTWVTWDYWKTLMLTSQMLMAARFQIWSSKTNHFMVGDQPSMRCWRLW